MYWPIGAPRSYEQQLPTKHAILSDDGYARSRSKSAEGKRTAKNENGDVPEGAEQGEEASQKVDAESYPEPDNEEAANKSDDGGIIGVRVSRVGSTFATITKTSLTVWQTKVCSHGLCYPQTSLLTSLQANRYSYLTHPIVSVLKVLWR